MTEKTGKSVAVVTGASRGVGRGVAVALGAAGMTVYVTGRSDTESVASMDGEVLPGTIRETAAAVTAAGGQGIAVHCDHADDAQVAALFERVTKEQGKLDILVNNAIYIDETLIDPEPFWEKPLSQVEILNVGLRSNYVAAYYAAPLLLKSGHALHVITSSYGAGCYMHGPAYGAQKAGGDKMAADMAVDFEGRGVASLSLWLGVQRTARTAAAARRRSDAYGDYIPRSESPEFVGRVIHALWKDAELEKRSGQVLIAAEVATDYGVVDDGDRQPPTLRKFLGAPPTYHPARVV